MVNPNWFLITFTQEEIDQKKDSEFLNDFVSLKKSMPDKNNLALFYRNYSENNKRTYFFPNVGDEFYSNLIRNYPSINRAQRPSSRPLTIAVGSKEDHSFWFDE